MRIAVVFPGQGSQYTGMGRDLALQEPVVADTIREADEALGFPLSHIMWEGPEDRLAETTHTQPAILTLSVAMWRLLQLRLPGLVPMTGAGHSLGEYGALVAAGCLSFSDAVRLVHFRGRAMQEAVPAGVGAMAAVLGLDLSQVEEACGQVRDEPPIRELVLEIAGINCPGQVVVAGHRQAVERAVEVVTTRGALEARILNVSAPFHTSLLHPARLRMEEMLEHVPLSHARFPVVQNADALPHQDPEEIRANLVAQVVRPVLWEATMRRFMADGVTHYVEVGPGRTLAGMARRIQRRLDVWSLDRPESWDLLHQRWSASWT